MSNMEILVFSMRVLNTTLIGIGISAWLIFYVRYKMVMAIAPITWLIHVLAYGIYRFLNPINESNLLYFSFWTTLVFFHGIIIMLISAYYSIPFFPKDIPKENMED